MRKRGIAILLIAMLLVQLAPVYGSYGAAYAATGGPSVGEAVYGHDGNDGSDGRGGDGGRMLTSLSTPPQKYVAPFLEYSWELETDIHLAPDAREMAGIAYDELNRKVVMFGGQGESSSILFDDTWLWDGWEETWREALGPGLAPLDPRPSARKSPAMAYDGKSGRVLLFGGEGSGGVLGDTWLWDGVNERWESLGVMSPGPSPRAGAQMAWDGTQLMLYGGYTGSGASKTPLGDTWLWNGTAWSKVTPENSPPPMFYGGIAYDGQRTALYGGNLGTVTEPFVNKDNTQNITYEKASSVLWLWDGQAQDWSTTYGPEVRGWGRWGNAMAYDGGRAVMMGGELDFINIWEHPSLNVIELHKNEQRPSDYANLDVSNNNPPVAYSWSGTYWEQVWTGRGKKREGYLTLGDWAQYYDTWPYNWPVGRSFASMVYDGKGLMLFGGNRVEVTIFASQGGPVDRVLPKGVVNETWTFRGPVPPSVPSVRLDELDIQIDPDRLNDQVSVSVSVYEDGGLDLLEVGIEYRLTDEPDSEWIKQPYELQPGETAVPRDFVSVISNLLWQRKYEVKGYAINAVGTSEMAPVAFELTDDPSMLEPDVVIERTTPAVLHVKDKKRLVAFGTGITNLLRKPVSEMNYYLEDENGVTYPLSVIVRNSKQAELFWQKDLPPGSYDVNLLHHTFSKYTLEDALTVVDTDFYKPRNFAIVRVPSTSSVNETGELKLQGLFTETPDQKDMFVLADHNDPVVINEAVLFKGSRLVVDKTAGDGGTAVISGTGRLYVNSMTDGGALPYTLAEGEFELTSDDFSMVIDNGGSTADLLDMGTPVRLDKLVFANGGARFEGEIEIGFRSGGKSVDGKFPFDSLLFRNNRFELTGTYVFAGSFNAGPFTASNAKLYLNSRNKLMDVTAEGTLPGTSVRFSLGMELKRSAVDSVRFSSTGSAALGSTGMRIDYMYGRTDGLAGGTELPQKLTGNASVSEDVGGLPFPLLYSGSLPAELSPYGLKTEGKHILFMHQLDGTKLQAVTNPAGGAVNGFSQPGFEALGELNVDGVIRGKLTALSYNKQGFAGYMTARVDVPSGIPHVGGATVNGVPITINEKGMFGAFSYNNVAVKLSYTFLDNVMMFNMTAPPPQPPGWYSKLSSVMEVVDFVNVFAMRQVARADVAVLASAPDEAKTTFTMKQTARTVQPEQSRITEGVAARIVEGKLTAVSREESLRSTVGGASGGASYRFDVEFPYTALITVSGNQTDAAVRFSGGGASGGGASGGRAAEAASHYDAWTNVTFIRVHLDRAGEWTLETQRLGEVRLHELMFAHASLTLADVAMLWFSAPERSVTALAVQRGTYWLDIAAAQGEAIVYKPDGRPYRIVTSGGAADRNAYAAADGSLHVWLDAAQAGTWIVDAGEAPTAALYRAYAGATITEAAAWLANERYATAIRIGKPTVQQAIVEIYGANDTTKLYAPDGALHPLVKEEGEQGWNAVYDEQSHTLTVVVEREAGIEGQWIVRSDSYVGVAAYEGSRKVKSPKLFQLEGDFSHTFELPEDGSYLLELGGADEQTLITDPDGKRYTLVFDPASPQRNASIQTAADRAAASGGTLDVRSNGRIGDSRDTLYVSMIDVKAGKWVVQTSRSITWSVQDIVQPAAFVEAAAEPVAGEADKVSLKWAVDYADPDTRVSVMLTTGDDVPLGETIALDLPAAGQTVVEIPAHIAPGAYKAAFVAQSAGGVPAHRIADSTVRVASPVALSAPGEPEVVSTGNGEVTLSFASSPGAVSVYRVWVEQDGEMVPAVDVVPDAGGQRQQAVVVGLPVGHTYTLAVSALLEVDGQRLSVSPLSAAVQASLPAPQPAGASVELAVAGDGFVGKRTYTARDGVEETLLFTAADEASLQVTVDQKADITLWIDGQQGLTKQAEAGGTATFALGGGVLPEKTSAFVAEIVNGNGDRSSVYGKVVVDRTKPLLIATNGNDGNGNPLALSGAIADADRLLVAGQSEAGAVITLNGREIPADDMGYFAYYAPAVWQDGEYVQEWVVAAEDAAGNKTESGFVVIRGEPDPAAEPSKELALLTVAGARLDASFSPDETQYAGEAFGEQIRIYAAAADASSKVTIGGQQVDAAGYADFVVPQSGRQVNIVVAPQNGGSLDSNVYTVDISGYLSGNAGLGQLEVNDATAGADNAELSAPMVSAGQRDYSMQVNHSVEQVTIAATPTQAGSTVTVNGTVVASGQASAAVSLETGDNFIPVVVTAPDSTQAEYEINIHREASGNAKLSTLSVSGAQAALSPAFDPDILNYSVIVPHGTESLTLTAAVNEPGATARISFLMPSVSSMATLPLTKDIETIPVRVESANGDALTYNVRVLRQQSSPGQAPGLTGLQLSGAVLDTEFSPYRFSYTAKRTSNSTVTVKAEASDALAAIEADGVAVTGAGTFKHKLEAGQNVIVLRVVSPDGTLSQIYSIAIERSRTGDDEPTGGEGRTIVIEGTSGGLREQTVVMRTTSPDGWNVDTLRLDDRTARDISTLARQTGDTAIRLVVTDLPDAPAQERFVQLDAGAVRALADNGLSVEIVLPEGRIVISGQTLSGMADEQQDMYFRIVPVQNERERGEVASRVQAAELVQAEAGEGEAVIIGQPLRIETNYSGFRTRLVFPLNAPALPADEQAAKQMLAELAVYIEHSDGSKSLQRGTIQYDEAGQPEIAIEVDKFSTFTIVRLTNSGAELLEPYVSGYPDGTFGPGRTLTRAELATILQRIAAAEAEAGAASESGAEAYPDVASTHWAAGAIAQVRALGLMVGDANGRFRPEETVTRAELAVIAAKWSEADTAAAPPHGYDDAGGHWAEAAIGWAKQAGLLVGDPSGAFRPNDGLTRAEAVTALNRLLQRPSPTVSVSRWPDVPAHHWALADIESASGAVRAPGGPAEEHAK